MIHKVTIYEKNLRIAVKEFICKDSELFYSLDKSYFDTLLDDFCTVNKLNKNFFTIEY